MRITLYDALNKKRYGGGMRGERDGFSVIELVIVVAIIMVILVIAVPGLLHTTIARNQGAALSSLRIVNAAEFNYKSLYNKGFSSTLAELGPPASGDSSPAAAGLVDAAIASGKKSGYTFTYTAAPPVDGVIQHYTLTANPITPGATGQTFYFTDESNKIRVNSSHPASASDALFGG
ncbi:MAG TPA: pili assembly chaperone [Terriglobia bacterium]|nr:pili assembly chaperone [Terriglobia bacterium]